MARKRKGPADTPFTGAWTGGPSPLDSRGTAGVPTPFAQFDQTVGEIRHTTAGITQAKGKPARVDTPFEKAWKKKIQYRNPGWPNTLG